MMRILAVERSAVGVLTLYSTVILLPPIVGVWFLQKEVSDHLDLCGSLVCRYVASVYYEHSIHPLEFPVALH